MNLITATRVAHNEGSIVVFEGTDGDDVVTFAVDHGLAWGLAFEIQTEGPVECNVEEWQILSRRPAQRTTIDEPLIGWDEKPIGYAPVGWDTATSGAVSDWLDDHGVPEDAR